MANRETPASDNRLVWYAVYGTNLLRGRFDCYMQGGKPKGATKESVGSGDKTRQVVENTVGDVVQLVRTLP